ncbi:hypothetical protein F2Q69_00008040 [Brassica cretica]|uniref:RNase H type-1 domain-containing protein n=1 Tax=Brassica cretica TaxID=69181 RepID=A0A8S9PDJ5_BRACR|nr:hypothetical protein F2Q69_00008040 [Brassica cretica]
MAVSSNWDIEKIELVLPVHKDQIFKLRASKLGGPDELVWLMNPSGERIQSLPPVELEAGIIAAWICWSLWLSRNHLIFQKRDFTPEETLIKALSDAREWTLAQSPPAPPPPVKPLIRIEPPPPHSDLCLVYTDASWNPLTGIAGFGWIFDDPVSPSQHSATSTFVSSPLMAEDLAARAVITSALSQGLGSILVLSDSQILINIINKQDRNLEVFSVFQDIYLLSLSFKSIKFKFISRLNNVVADYVAKHALWSVYPV